MRKLLLALIFAAISSSVLGHDNKEQTHQSELSGSESAPGQVVLSFHKALRDQDKVIAKSLLSDNVIIVEGGRVERSAQEYASHHMLSDMKFLSTLTSELVEHTVKEYSDSATSLTVSVNTAESGKIYRSYETAVLTKRDGKWKIAHLHWSTAK
ncbi:nuclear transport factor 2 family protein [Alteromonas sp. ASW11-19]|uniref:Nuclear transport factor 2 family protein n=1 Tax=Alteromonas salexigens TaxID=2982530 RepID=A0ABT2VQP8_9ALTE|nr:nuclear transport factor 2 family protein [Alteromonas salexigens]MCU7555399.1 nuclear transport factor 2 family protein [Alteromonas salexigens]